MILSSGEFNKVRKHRLRVAIFLVLLVCITAVCLLIVSLQQNETIEQSINDQGASGLAKDRSAQVTNQLNERKNTMSSVENPGRTPDQSTSNHSKKQQSSTNQGDTSMTSNNPKPRSADLRRLERMLPNV